MLPCPLIIINRKLPQPDLSRMINRSNASGMRIWVTSPGKESRPAEILAENGGNTE